MGELSSLVAQDFVHQQFQHWHVSWILIFLIDSHCWKFLQQVLAIVFCQLSTKIVMSQGEKQPNYGESHSNQRLLGVKNCHSGWREWHFASPPLFQYLELETSFVLAAFFGFNLCSVIEILQLQPDLMAQQTPEVSINMDLDVSFWSLLNLYVFSTQTCSQSSISVWASLAGKMGLIWMFSEWLGPVDKHIYIYRLSNTSRAPFGR